MKSRSHMQGMAPAAPILFLVLFVLFMNQSNLFAAPISSSAGAPSRSASDLRVGAAKVNITPSDLKGLNSFGDGFKDVHDPIFARALVLTNGVNTAAIVTLDLIEIGDTTEVRQRIQRELGIPVSHILITASHDHNAPRAGSITPGALAHGNNPQTDAFTKVLYDRILEVVKQAKDSLQPAQFGVGIGSSDVNVNRDHYTPGRGWGLGYSPNRPSVKTVWVLKFTTMSGQPIAIFFDYAVHSTVTLGSARLSGDLAGDAERFVEQAYGNKLVALYSMGPAGDQNPKYDGSGPSIAKDHAASGPGGVSAGQDAPKGPPMIPAQSPERSAAAFAAMNAEGFMLGSEVVRVSSGIEQMTSSVRLNAAERIISCPTKRGTNQLADMKQQQVTSMPIHLGLILLNDVALVGVSGEVVTNIYLHLQRESPLKDTILLTMANDRIGYIADDAAYDTPLFEVNGSPLARGCAEDGIVDNLVQMIDQFQ